MVVEINGNLCDIFDKQSLDILIILVFIHFAIQHTNLYQLKHLTNLMRTEKEKRKEKKEKRKDFIQFNVRGKSEEIQSKTKTKQKQK